MATKTTPNLNEIATTGDGRDITRPWVMDLQQPRDPRLLSARDWGIYDKILMDDQVKSCMEQRISAVVSAQWDVLPGDENEPRSIKAALEFKAMLERAGWDRITRQMLYAPFHGYAVAELLWSPPSAMSNTIDFKVKVRHARRFRYDKDFQLRLLTMANPKGELLPNQKFWVVSAGASNDDEPYGHGFADWLYWLTLFKRNGIRFWNLFLDKYGTPQTIGTYRKGTPVEDQRKLLAAQAALASDSGVAVPEGTTIALLEATRSASGDFSTLIKMMDDAIAKVILSQTMTTQDGSSHAQAKVHAGVKMEIVKADADLLSDSFNEGPARWWTDLNFGTDVASPQLIRLVEEEADLKLMAETDEILARTGWARTEDSFRDIYGDGYEKIETPPAAPIAAPVPGEAKPAATDQTAVNDNLNNPPANAPAAVGDKAISFANVDPAPVATPDIVDEAAAELLKAHGYTPLTPAMQAVINALENSNSAEEFDQALLSALPKPDADLLVSILAKAGFSLRIGAEAGEPA